MFTLEVVSDRTRLDQLETAWNDLADRLGNPLLRHEWFVESARAFSASSRLAVHLAWDGPRLRAVAPLVLQRSGGVTRLQMLGAENYEPEAFLHDDDAALALVCEAVARIPRPLALLRLDAGSRELSLLEQAHRGRGVTVLRADTTQTNLNTVDVSDWKAFLAAMSSGRRKELERKRKGLEKLGAVSFEALAPTPETFDAPFEALVAVEASGWKSANGTAIAQMPRARAFFTGFGRRMAEHGLLRLFFLRVDGRVVAAQYHVQHAGKLWELKIAYDEAVAKHSPGALLTHEVLRYCCEQGLSGIEHLGAAEDWQRRWPTQTRDHSTLRLYPANPLGALALAVDTADFARRKLALKLRQRKRPAPAEPAAVQAPAAIRPAAAGAAS